MAAPSSRGGHERHPSARRAAAATGRPARPRACTSASGASKARRAPPFASAAARSSTSAPTTTSAWPTIPPSSRRPTRGCAATATAWRRCASSAARRTCTSSSKRPSPRFFGKDDAILYSSCWDANGGLFETILGDEDAVLSDELNHASIIDGVRLCKAKRFRYKHGDMAELETGLKEAQGQPAAPDRHRRRLLDGRRRWRSCRTSATWPTATTPSSMVDDSHATGILGASGRGTPEHCGVPGPRGHHHQHARQDAGRRGGRLHLRRRRGRRVPAAAVAAVPVLQRRCRRRSSTAALKALELVGDGSELRDRLHANAAAHAGRPGGGGLHAQAGQHPILPVMLGDAALASRMADRLLEQRHLRHRLQLPGGAAGAGAHPPPDVGGAHAGADRPGRRGVHRGGPRAGGDRWLGGWVVRWLGGWVVVGQSRGWWLALFNHPTKIPTTQPPNHPTT